MMTKDRCCWVVVVLCGVLVWGAQAQATSNDYKKARRWVEEAKVLIGIDDREAAKILRRAMQQIPQRHPLYRRAARLLRRFAGPALPRLRPSEPGGPGAREPAPGPAPVFRPSRLLKKILSGESFTQKELLFLQYRARGQTSSTLWRRWGWRLLWLSWGVRWRLRAWSYRGVFERPLHALRCAFELPVNPAPLQAPMCSYEHRICLPAGAGVKR